MFYSDLSLTAQTTFAQLLDAIMATEHFRSVADLPGSFAAKTVKGHRYWYYQFTEPSGKLRQLFVGPDNEVVQKLVEYRTRPSVIEPLIPLVRASVALGCAPILPRHMKVISRLAEYGFFRAGGVLVGTHAFLAYSNMLGVRWGDISRTQDIDFAHAGKSIALALPSNLEVKTGTAIESLQMGFLPITGLTGRGGATYLIPQEPDFRLDFLTTMHRGGDTSFEHPQLHIHLQPLKFMEFSLEQVQQTVLFSQDGSAVIVSIPHPARYALHKLLIFGERQGTFATKSMKDLHQAASLLAFFKEMRPWEVEERWADILSRGKGWASRAKHGLDALEKQFPEMGIKAWLQAAQ